MMMMMSGHTLGFFFPKQAKYMAADQPKVSSVREFIRTESDSHDVFPVITAEGAEVPASFYFYRYF